LGQIQEGLSGRSSGLKIVGEKYIACAKNNENGADADEMPSAESICLCPSIQEIIGRDNREHFMNSPEPKPISSAFMSFAPDTFGRPGTIAQ
jgi:hypothetical protein